MSDVGRIWKSERRTETDAVTGLEVQRLTGYLGHSHHFYFTNPGWYDNGRRLLIASARENRTNLFSIELCTGELTQLTAFTESATYPPNQKLIYSSLNPKRDEVYLWSNDDLIALDLKSFSQRLIYRVPCGFTNNMTSVSSDGESVLTGIYEDLTGRFNVNLHQGYIGFKEYFEARPLSQIVEIKTNGSGSRVVYEEDSWIGHVSASPSQSNLVSFCHEGPWNLVDCRMWMLDRTTGKIWKVRPTKKDEQVGHEFWLADGVHLGFHGKTRTGDGTPIVGWIRYDNTELLEAPLPQGSIHTHSNTMDLVVGDGDNANPYVYLWKFQNGAFSEPRKLCLHRCSFHVQQTHVHPRFSPDGAYVIFTSDTTGYGNVYKVDIPSFGFA